MRCVVSDWQHLVSKGDAGGVSVSGAATASKKKKKKQLLFSTSMARNK